MLKTILGTLAKISEDISLQQQFEQYQKFVKEIADELPGVIFQLRRDSGKKYSLLYVGSRVFDYLGVESKDALRNIFSVLKCIKRSHLKVLKNNFERSACSGLVFYNRFEISRKSISGLPIILELVAMPKVDAKVGTLWHGFVFDVTNAVQIERKIEKAYANRSAIISAIPDILLTVDDKYSVLMSRAPSSTIFGYPQDSLVGCRLNKILEEPAASILNMAFRQADVVGSVQNIEFPVFQEGVLKHYECSIAVNIGSTEEVVRYVVTIRDVSDKKIAQDQIVELTYYDSLTGLFNRRSLLEQMGRISLQAGERQRQYAVLLINIDHFKDLNDTYGYHAGDELLRQFASRMCREIRDGDLLARFGGDEFVVVIPDLLPGMHAQAVAKRVANGLLDCMRASFSIGTLSYKINCSIGVAIGESEGVSNVIKSAAIAVRQAKSLGRGIFYFCDNEVQNIIIERSTIEQDLRLAVETEQFIIYYQPIVNWGRDTVGYEALLRWQHPVRGIVSPDSFVSIAEQCGLIVSIGRWVLKTVAKFLARRLISSPEDQTYMAINISALQVQQVNFVNETLQIFSESGVSPTLVKFELTESLLHADLAGTIEKMMRLKNAGINFLLDDFGTGYSSMSYLRRLPLQQLKIDRSFVKNLPSDRDDAAIANFIIQLAKIINVTVVAEGVETEEQETYLKSIGCDFFQGYFFGKPMPI